MGLKSCKGRRWERREKQLQVVSSSRRPSLEFTPFLLSARLLGAPRLLSTLSFLHITSSRTSQPTNYHGRLAQQAYRTLSPRGAHRRSARAGRRCYSCRGSLGLGGPQGEQEGSSSNPSRSGELPTPSSLVFSSLTDLPVSPTPLSSALSFRCRETFWVFRLSSRHSVFYRLLLGSMRWRLGSLRCESPGTSSVRLGFHVPLPPSATLFSMVTDFFCTQLGFALCRSTDGGSVRGWSSK